MILLSPPHSAPRLLLPIVFRPLRSQLGKTSGSFVSPEGKRFRTLESVARFLGLIVDMNEGQKEGAAPTSAVGASAPTAGAAAGVSTVKSSRFISHRHPSWAALGCEVEIVEVRAFDILCGDILAVVPTCRHRCHPLAVRAHP